jgi:PQQ-dependent catabolism-associated beta-propeller protein
MTMMKRRSVLAGGAALAALALARPVHAAGTGNIFVSTEKGNEVVVLDPSYNIIKRIATSRRPRDMQMTRAHDLLYVACGDDDSIDVIDVAGLEVIDSIPTGPSPEMFRLSDDEGSIYVSDEENSTVERIDLKSKIATQTIPSGAEPEGILIMPGGEIVFATSEVADMVHIIDTKKGAVIKNILVGTRPRRFIHLPTLNEVWVSCELSSEIFIIDATSYEIKGDSLVIVPPGFREQDVTPVGMTSLKDDSKVLLSLGRANHIAILDARSHDVLAFVLTGKRCWSIDLSRDEKTAIVANGLSDDITVVDMQTMQPVQSLPIGRVPHTVVIDD